MFLWCLEPGLWSFATAPTQRTRQANDGLALAYLRSRRLEYFALSLGQTLDALSGNFVEDGVHFFAQEFFGRQILHRLRAGPPPKPRPLGVHLDQAAQRPAFGLPQPWPMPVPMNGVAHKDHAGEHAPKMGGVGDMRPGGVGRGE